jgi:hypothetical protein
LTFSYDNAGKDWHHGENAGSKGETNTCNKEQGKCYGKVTGLQQIRHGPIFAEP